MKMLKKLAALILAATMVLVLFTACGGDTTPTPEAQAETQIMSAINANRGQKLENNAQCRAIASQHIDEVANGGKFDLSWGLLGYSSKVWIKIDGPKDGKCVATFVTTFDYDGTKLNKFVQKITDSGNLGNANIAQSTKWTQVGVVVKAVNGHTYMAISVAFDKNA
ncbi:MAG: hypothetical protein KH108_06005 [Faecalibacterium prausnitzii]|nr:hypothetical protein [Faecalibacterium prausnitzii]